MGWDQGQTTWFHFYLLGKKKKPKKLSNKNMQLMVHHKGSIVGLMSFVIYFVLLHPHHRSKFPWNLLIIKTCFKLSHHVKCWTVHFLKSVKPQTTSLSAPHCLVLFSPNKNYLERKTDTFTFRPGWSIHTKLWITVNTFLTHTVKTTQIECKYNFSNVQDVKNVLKN